jgi:hypothetical protein
LRERSEVENGGIGSATQVDGMCTCNTRRDPQGIVPSAEKELCEQFKTVKDRAVTQTETAARGKDDVLSDCQIMTIQYQPIDTNATAYCVQSNSCNTNDVIAIASIDVIRSGFRDQKVELPPENRTVTEAMI